jgi:hypothetical protein
VDAEIHLALQQLDHVYNRRGIGGACDSDAIEAR